MLNGEVVSTSMMARSHMPTATSMRMRVMEVVSASFVVSFPSMDVLFLATIAAAAAAHMEAVLI